MIVGARAVGITEGQMEGKVEMAQDAICKYLNARFSVASLNLQSTVREIKDFAVLDRIINKIYTANSLDEASTIVCTL